MRLAPSRKVYPHTNFLTKVGVGVYLQALKMKNAPSGVFHFLVEDIIEIHVVENALLYRLVVDEFTLIEPDLDFALCLFR